MKNLLFLEARIALKYLFNRTDEKFVSLISLFAFFGIFFGVATLIIVISVMNGFREKFISGILGVSGHIKISTAIYRDFSNNNDNIENIVDKNQIFNYQNLLEKIKKFQNSQLAKELFEKHNVKIISAYPEISGQALMKFGNYVQGVYVLGVGNLEERKEIKNSIIIEKNFNFISKNPLDKEKILIGIRLFEKLSTKISDKISLISPSSESLLIGEVQNSKDFQIGGIFETKIFDIDSSLVYIDIDFARYFFNLEEDSVSQIEIRTSNPSKSLILKNELRKFIENENHYSVVRSSVARYDRLKRSDERQNFDISDSFLEKNEFQKNEKEEKKFQENEKIEIETFYDENSLNSLIFSDWSEVNGQYLKALETEKKVMFLILSFIIFIAVFNVVSSLVMLVNEKEKSIAILKTMGMTSSSILRIFFYCGFLISFFGIIFGVSFGVLFCLNLNYIRDFLEYRLGFSVFDPLIYFFKDIPALIDFRDIFYIVFFTILISVIVIIFPSLKASKKDPASILKYF